MIGVTGGCMLMAAICVGSRKWPRVDYEQMTTPKLGNGAALRILHLSDLHGDSPSRIRLNVWRRVEKLQFHMAVITGDVILRHPDELRPHLEWLASLAKRVPVFFAEGNHDVLYAAPIRHMLEGAGVHTLYNETSRVWVNGVALTVIGLRDLTVLEANGFAGLDELFGAALAGEFSLALIHQPQLFDRIQGFKPDLTLAGHTHGGQVRLPFFPVIYAPGQGVFPRYGSGWYGRAGCRLYVSRGLGATYFPIRFWNRPQISVITVHGQ